MKDRYLLIARAVQDILQQKHLDVQQLNLETERSAMPSTMDGLVWKYENCMTIVSVLSIRCLTELKFTVAIS